MTTIRTEIRDFYDDYALALDDLNLDQWLEFFTEDCLYRVVPLEGFRQGLPLSTVYCKGLSMVRDRVTSIREASVFEPRAVRHLVSAVKVNQADVDGWSSQANFVVYQSLLDRESSLLLVGRYLDRVVRQDGALKFRERVCVYDNYQIPTSLVYPV